LIQLFTRSIHKIESRKWHDPQQLESRPKSSREPPSAIRLMIRRLLKGAEFGDDGHAAERRRPGRHTDDDPLHGVGEPGDDEFGREAADAGSPSHAQALFGTIAHTFNHILVIEDIFRAHLEGRKHDYTARNTKTAPPFAEVRERLGAIDLYYVDLAERLSAEELNETVHFEFVGGGAGAMTRQEILLHLVNHATYHRGFVSDMLFQIPFSADANDLTVFLRDAWP
jgi:uncharacterized damage-inducible protein DinB